tara:strand:+ start:194 stop:829 length:636 start_codon:yes stop_codon:yes gene_type:complete
MLFVVFALFFLFKDLNLVMATESPPKKWPCDQVYNPKLNMSAIWGGPDIKDYIKDWWKDDEVIEVATKLSDPILTEKDGTKIIESFAKKYTYFGIIAKKEQEEKLVNLFAGLFQKASDKRRRQYTGIVKFVERQDVIRKTIGKSSKKLRELRKAGVGQDDKEFLMYSEQMKWNTRVFDQRTRLTEYVCEEPVYGEQRIGYQARKILSYIKD